MESDITEMTNTSLSFSLTRNYPTSLSKTPQHFVLTSTAEHTVIVNGLELCSEANKTFKNCMLTSLSNLKDFPILSEATIERREIQGSLELPRGGRVGPVSAVRSPRLGVPPPPPRLSGPGGKQVACECMRPCTAHISSIILGLLIPEKGHTVFPVAVEFDGGWRKDTEWALRRCLFNQTSSF